MTTDAYGRTRNDNPLASAPGAVLQENTEVRYEETRNGTQILLDAEAERRRQA